MTERKLDFTPTPEQEAIRLAARSSTSSIMIPALAGTGKTTTLALGAREIKVPGLALAFNVHIMKELHGRFPPNFKVQTMNSLGMGSLGRALPGDLKLDDQKLGKIVNEVSKDWKWELADGHWDTLLQLARSAMLQGIVPGDAGDRPIIADSPEVWRDLALDFLVSEDEIEPFAEMAREIVSRNNEAVRRQRVISFLDQIYYSTCVKGRFPQYPVLLVDEAQDLDPLQHQMLQLASRPDARFFICGDPNQAIYAFRGADHESMGKIKKLRHDWQELPLTVTFRCPKVVVKRQLWHVPQYKAAPQAPEGAFVRLPRGESGPSESGPSESFTELCWSWEDLKKLAPNAESDFAILCRNNAPLLTLAFQLLRQSVPVRMLGRDIGKNLVALTRKLAKSDSTTLEELRAALDAWEVNETTLLIANGKPERCSGVSDRAECIRAVLDQGVARDVGELRRELTALFARETGKITLSSVHKSKGLEWDVVMLLDPWRIPSKWAKEVAQQGDDRQLTQEYNLKYVAETRTKSVLVHANAKEFME